MFWICQVYLCNLLCTDLKSTQSGRFSEAFQRHQIPLGLAVVQQVPVHLCSGIDLQCTSHTLSTSGVNLPLLNLPPHFSNKNLDQGNNMDSDNVCNTLLGPASGMNHLSPPLGRHHKCHLYCLSAPRTWWTLQYYWYNQPPTLPNPKENDHMLTSCSHSTGSAWQSHCHLLVLWKDLVQC